MFNADSSSAMKVERPEPGISGSELNLILQGFHLPLPYFLVLSKTVNQHNRNSSLLYGNV
jgi:hypothetical protein